MSQTVKVGDKYENTHVNDTPIPVGAMVRYDNPDALNPCVVDFSEEHGRKYLRDEGANVHGGCDGTFTVLTLPAPAPRAVTGDGDDEPPLTPEQEDRAKKVCAELQAEFDALPKDEQSRRFERLLDTLFMPANPPTPQVEEMDTGTEEHKSRDRTAVRCVADLRTASDRSEVATPSLVGRVQDAVSEAIRTREGVWADLAVSVMKMRIRLTDALARLAVAEGEKRRLAEALPGIVSTIPCCECNGPVVEFVVPNDIWNAVIRSHGEHDREYLCLDCWYAALRRKLSMEAV